ncbi:FIST C-terminal domain-containing protein [Methylomonas sp. SURF-2]|uniref:FIST C-terminal domain-containing protein n=1 Tax=Methylomonas subterranea TaxID=2952225 RepID=A0ABT1TCY6_9GAMM|nr:FIST C-terminal domain-containing protein [Methylomonas sp. SURF-2]MCQ8102962.1 FIST C-terminal domain-containing protein [Methylomonas sp. SURF-2]
MSSGGMVYFSSFDMEKIAGLLSDWRSECPAMGVLALVPEAEKTQVAGLQIHFRQRKIPLCGAIFPQLIYGSEFRRTGLCLLRFDSMPYVALHDDLPGDAAEAARIIADGVGPRLDDDIPATLFLLLDAMLPNIGSLLDELYLSLANRVHYAGVNAGSETFQAMPCLFDSQRQAGNGVLALLLKPHPGAVLEHGYQSGEHSLPATSTEGNRIIHIDWRPAFEVYRELVLRQFGVEINRDNFYRYAVHFPFGIVRANHSTLVRIPVMLDEDNALFCIGEVPAHSMLTLLEAPRVDSSATLETLRLGLSQLRGKPAAAGLLLFYCAGRKQHMGAEAATEELRAFGQLTGASGVAGALALGEIGESTLWGYPLFQNATLVTADWGSGQ